MTPEQGRGMQVLKRLADDALERMPRDEAQSFIDGMSNPDFAEALKALSAGGVAANGQSGGNLFYESAATRILALATEKPCDCPARPLTTAELLDVQGVKVGKTGTPAQFSTRAKRSTSTRRARR